MRQYSFLDRVVTHIDESLKTMTVPATASHKPNIDAGNDEALSKDEKDFSARLMRVNHAGEIAAQGLYTGQALSAKHKRTKKILRTMAHEEADHLAWCENRLHELNSHTSLLTPLWYLGSLGIGVLAGSCEERYSFGFVKETEDQVVMHLDSHLGRISPQDTRTISLIEKIKADEAEHAAHATAAGATELPIPIKRLMRLTARIMTRVAHYI